MQFVFVDHANRLIPIEQIERNRNNGGLERGCAPVLRRPACDGVVPVITGMSLRAKAVRLELPIEGLNGVQRRGTRSCCRGVRDGGSAMAIWGKGGELVFGARKRRTYLIFRLGEAGQARSRNERDESKN